MKIGGLHAEASLLQELDVTGRRHLLNDGTMYVTLEPCAHFGRTPPCAAALAKTTLRKVVIGTQDPNPMVNGSGAGILRAAGIDTVFDPAWSAECEELAEFFLNAITASPAGASAVFVGLKVASTFDGVIARKGDSRKWITSVRAREYGHYLRQRYDAILIGPGTILADNPSLTVRHSGFTGRTPIRVCLDPEAFWLNSLSLKDSPLIKSEPNRTIVIVSEFSHLSLPLESLPITVVRLPVEKLTGHFSWPSVLQCLTVYGVQSLLIEGGAGVYDSILESGLVNKFHWFRSPDKSGFTSEDPSALRWHLWDQIATISSGRNSKYNERFQLLREIELDRDTLIEGYLNS